jgi:hypothetical protein
MAQEKNPSPEHKKERRWLYFALGAVAVAAFW